MIRRIAVLLFTLLIAGCAMLNGPVPVEEREMLVSVPFHYPHGNLGCAQAYSHSPLLAFVTSQQNDRSARLSLYSPNTGLLLLVQDSYPTYVAVGQHDCHVELPDDLFQSSKELPVTCLIIANDSLKAFLKKMASKTSPLSAEDGKRLETLITNPPGSPFFYEAGKGPSDWGKIESLSAADAATVYKVNKYLNLSKRNSESGRDATYRGGYRQLWMDFEQLDQNSVHTPID